MKLRELEAMKISVANVDERKGLIMNDYRDNLEIDLKDLLFSLLKKWNLIVLAVILGVVVGACFGVYAGRPSTTERSNQSQPDEIVSKLSKKEKTDVELAYRAYLDCIELYDFEESQGELSSNERIELLKATQQILGINAGLSSDQRAYFSALFDEDKENRDSSLVDNANYGEKKRISLMNWALKYSVLGGALGLIIIVVMLSCGYIFAPTLKTEDDIRRLFDLPIIGGAEFDSHNTNMIVSGISACAKKGGANKVCIISSCNDAKTSQEREKIRALFEGKDFHLSTGGSIFSDSDTIDEIVASDGVVLLEVIGKSVYDDIAREIEICKNCGAPILGTIVIK